MSRVSPRNRPTPGLFAARPSSREARRSAGGSELESAPVAPPQLPASPPAAAAPPSPSPHQQKLALYAGGALVVLIVIVILLLSPRRPPISLVPKGQTVVQVVDVRRFFGSPVYQVLSTLSHPLMGPIEAKEERYNISLRRDVVSIVDTDDSTILIGRFRAERMRDSFEMSIEASEKEINRGRQNPVQLQIQQAEVEGYPYSFCNQEGVDHAFTSLGSSIVCFGDRWGVRRFLKGRAGLRGHALDDDAFASAYSPVLARRAFLCRLEKPGGKIVTTKLKAVLAEAGEGVRATFFAVATTSKAIELSIRFAAKDPAAAERIEAQLAKASAQVALRPLLGADASLKISRAESVVTLEASMPLDSFDEIVEKDKKGQGSNLVLTLLAS